MIYDMVVIGGGIAGVTTAQYGKFFGLKNVLLIEEAKIGGKINYKANVENIPFAGPNITKEFMIKGLDAQINYWGIETKNDSVISIKKNASKTFSVITKDQDDFEAKSIVIATGLRINRLDVPGDSKYEGNGVYYMAAMHKETFEDQEVAIIGGGRGAQDYLLAAAGSNEFSKAYWIANREVQKDTDSYKKILAIPNVEILEYTKVVKILGDEKVWGIQISQNGQERKLNVAGVFPFIGSIPDSVLATQLGLKLDPNGYIVINKKYETSLKGVYAVGDICTKQFRNLITAVGDGNLAGASAASYVQSLNK